MTPILLKEQSHEAQEGYGADARPHDVAAGEIVGASHGTAAAAAAASAPDDVAA
eukprot:CAMPEP_0197435598 /NCGR_PEP_ID=MMETSP1175-20131217/3170_1 /TAXON_ID=1003142 /ORGANISM="Triceratium dubium, Strain CCMP147" /LENGTH=53 /DNA_ID=CAMNT_0042964677 /DNA_START=921 /DNA_END=1078 /DNA_ORIENTATION=+